MRGFRQGKRQTPQPRLNAGFGGRFGQLQLQAGEREVGCLAPTPGFTSSGNAGRSRPCGLRKAAKLRWVACASCFEIVGCCAGFSLRSGALTGGDDVVQELRRKTRKKPCVKGRIGKTRRESAGYSLWVVVLMLLTEQGGDCNGKETSQRRRQHP